MNKTRINLSLAHPSGKELQYISEVIDSNWITTTGPQIKQFEKELELFLHTEKPVVALNSGTSALHLALISLHVEPGDEIICQDITFVASVNPIRYVGAYPVLVDSEKETWNLSPELMEEVIIDRIKKTGKKPKAIIPVDLYGMPARLPEIIRIADKYDIPVLEDSAESLGAYILEGKEKKFCSTFGYCGLLSFNGNKIITTSGGGGLVCNDVAQAGYLRFLSGQAKDTTSYYSHSEIGYNYNMSNVCAAIGLAQMEVLQQHVDRRREINQLYRSELSLVPGLEFQNEPEGYFSNYWLTCVLFENAEICRAVRLFLEKENIESKPLWTPMHLQPIYNEATYYGSHFGEQIFARGLCLPSSSILTNEDIIRVCESIKKCLKIK
jgi:dTDP-4-amino-4,6-dideoxygalactose transaminase